MPLEQFTTIAQPGEGEYVEKRSRFLGVAFPIKTPEEATALVAQIKAKHYDARHHCYAYRLKDGSSRYADDGEPAGTAGLPILDVLSRKDITDCIIIVTRYFGGTLLGTGGLVRSYTAAANEALANAPLLTMERYTSAQLTCDYNQYGRLEPLVVRCGGLIGQTVFGEQVTIPFDLPTPHIGQFTAQLREMTAGQVEATLGEERFAGCHEGTWRFECL